MGVKYSDIQKQLIQYVRTDDIAGVEQLIASGFDVDCELKYGSSALMIAASRGYAEMIEVLAKAGAKMNRRNRFGVSALMESVEKGKIDCIRKLVEHGAEINMPHNNGTTVLLAATMRRDVKTIKALLELGACKETANFDGWTPLKWATSESNQSLIDVLGGKHVSDGENSTAVDKSHGETSHDESPPPPSGIRVMNNTFWTAFMRAASNGDAKSVRLLAEEEGVEVNGQSPNGTTALIAAAKHGHQNTVFELIELGADLNLPDQEGLTALAWAAKRGDVMLVQELKKRGAVEDEGVELDREEVEAEHAHPKL